MMQLINVTVIKNLTAKTSNANYQIECHLISDNIYKVHVTVFSNDDGQFIGNINLENGTTSCNFPIETTVIPFFEDFDTFIAEIKEDTNITKTNSNILEA
jgi:hypothetical protein|nr:MAG TPA: hypothetical protein [Caudoviricetes sp.]